VRPILVALALTVASRLGTIARSPLSGSRFAGLLALASIASVASARPISPRAGGFEIGGAGFLGVQKGAGSDTAAGPLLHLAVRLPASESIIIGLMGRLGVALGPDGGPTSLIALDGRWMFGDLDLAPYAALGLGVLFRALPDDQNLATISQRPDFAVPLGLGIETRLTDSVMLGFAIRYTLVASDLDRTVGPLDATICLIFL